MVKKTGVIEIESEEVSEEVKVPQPISTDFGREDLNALRDAVNFLLSKE